jgi:hypothetical protein
MGVRDNLSPPDDVTYQVVLLSLEESNSPEVTLVEVIRGLNVSSCLLVRGAAASDLTADLTCRISHCLTSIRIHARNVVNPDSGQR